MEPNHTAPSMSQKIFDSGLPVETISLYLLCCGLTDGGEKISTSNIRHIWNGSDEPLQNGFKALEKRNIIRKIISDDAGNNVYRLINVEQWKLS